MRGELVIGNKLREECIRRVFPIPSPSRPHFCRFPEVFERCCLREAMSLSFCLRSHKNLGEQGYVQALCYHWKTVAKTQPPIEFRNSCFLTNTFSSVALKLFGKKPKQTNKQTKKLVLNTTKKTIILLFSIAIKTSQSYQYLRHWYCYRQRKYNDYFPSWNLFSLV